MTASRAFVAFGANLGDAVKAFDQACNALDALPDSRVSARSSLYRSAPIGVSDHPDYINAVIRLDTKLGAECLLDALLQIETGHGRVRAASVLPRTMDLDLLMHDDLITHSERLTLPHPRMHKRAFVLLPLAELVPDLNIPLHGPVSSLLAGLADQQIERLPALQPDRELNS